MRRVNEAIRQVLADVLAGELADPRLGFVTVTDVRTSPDLRDARVFVSVLGDEEARTGSLAALASAHGLLQGRIATQLSLKRTPRLEFVYDPTTDRALRVESLLRDEQ
jgi:ribosome-binding factor A